MSYGYESEATQKAKMIGKTISECYGTLCNIPDYPLVKDGVITAFVSCLSAVDEHGERVFIYEMKEYGEVVYGVQKF